MWQKIIQDRRTIGVLTLFLIVAAVPLTLYLGNKEQDVRQRAASTTTCSVNNPVDAMLLIDKSGSMGPPINTDNRIDPAKDAAKNFVSILYKNGSTEAANRKSQAGVVSFAQLLNGTEGRTELDAPLTLLSSQTNVDSVNSKIQAIEIFGRTCIDCAVKLANAEIKAHGRAGVKKVVILLTDGGANAYDGHLTADQPTAEAAANASIDAGHQESGTIFFTIGLGTDVNTSFLKSVASRTGGQYFFAPTASDLDGIYQQISTIVGKGSIQGSVYNDLNKNKTQDSTEVGLTGWKVSLVDPSNKTTVASTTTDTKGNYTFTGVCDGSYQNTLTLQSNWDLTTPTNPEYLSPTVLNGNTVTGQNFGVALHPATTSLVCSPTSVTLTSAPQALNVTLKDSSGNPLSGKNISWNGNTTSQLSSATTSTNTNGVAAVNISIPETTTTGFTDTITATYQGDIASTTSSCQIKATFTPQNTTLSLNALLHGLGNGGDNANLINTSLSNKNPLHPTRNATIIIKDIDNNVVKQLSTTITFNPTSGSFTGAFNLGSDFKTGRYLIKVMVDRYLYRALKDTIQINANRSNQLPTMSLISSDVNADNVLNILDYNAIMDCYSDYLPPVACTSDQKIATDANDDGTVNQKDNNLFYREWSVQFGD